MKEMLFEGWQEYADLRFLAALAETDSSRARGQLESVMKLWDGTGFDNRATVALHRYSTYKKLALAMIAVAKVKVTLTQQTAILERLLTVQGKEGGWITDYDARRQHVVLANVETTSLAILALGAAMRA